MPSEFDRFPLLYESYGSETRDVTVYVSTGNFKFEILETVDETGAARSKFRQGETVYCHYKVRNDGSVKDRATIIVTDIDTGAKVTEYLTDYCDPGWKFEAAKATVGTMPNKDWKLRFAMTP